MFVVAKVALFKHPNGAMHEASVNPIFLKCPKHGANDQDYAVMSCVLLGVDVAKKRYTTKD
jgi:hypothetical protein